MENKKNYSASKSIEQRLYELLAQRRNLKQQNAATDELIEEAWKDWGNEHTATLVALLRKRDPPSDLINTGHYEEAVTDALATGFEKLEERDLSRSLVAWMVQTAFYHLQNLKRKLSKEREASLSIYNQIFNTRDRSGSSELDSLLHLSGDETLAKKMFSVLSKTEKEYLKVWIDNGLRVNHKEIARLANIKEAYSRTLMSRVKSKIRSAWPDLI